MASPDPSILLQVVATYPQLLHHEDIVSKSPFAVMSWIMYLDEIDTLMMDNKTNELVWVREMNGRRAVKSLPRSYKLWKLHWEFCLSQKASLGHPRILQMFELCLTTLSKFPRVWMEYLEYVHSSSTPSHPTFLRRLANRCLESLPVTQHDKIWPVLLKYYKDSNTLPNETRLCLLRRYVEFRPEAKEEIANFIADHLGRFGEAALLYVDLLNTPRQPKKDIWMALAKICGRHDVIGLDFEAMVRAILKAPKAFGVEELEGVIWNQLADAWIRRGEFQLARSVYEEALEKVSKVRDFTILLDAYLQFEEGLLEATMQAQEESEGMEEEEESSNDDNGDDWDLLVTKQQQAQQNKDDTTTNMADLELALARAEDLTTRRPLLLNRVLLRQNPHDVGEWLKRARLYKENEQIAQAAAALEEALQTVTARRAFGGSPNQLVLELVKLYEEDSKDVGKARDLLDRICNQWVYEFKNVDDLAECHAAWVELELRQEAWDDALDVIRRSVVVDPKAPKVVRGLAKSLRLWDLLLDLEESLGTMQTTKDAYNRAMEQRVATPMHILNFASFLTEHKYFEESFAAYERGLELFDFPGVKVIWKAYLESFAKRYGGDKLERLRDLYQRCLEGCPSEEASDFYIMNGQLEEEYGLAKRALGVYRRMCQKVPPSEKYTAYQLFIAKTVKFMGQTATRDIYQSAIQDLDDTAAALMCLDFSKMETSLQEIDRARAILKYGAQMADPRRNEDYWRDWNGFEIEYGNEETFREMLRIKRSVEASFSTVNYNAAEMSTEVGKGETLSNEEAMKMIAEREGVELEPHQMRQQQQQQQPISGFVGAKRTAQSANLDDVEERVAKLRKATQATDNDNDDDDEIDLDDLDEDDNVSEDMEKSDSFKDISQKTVPAAVFGGLAKLTNHSE